MKHTLMAARDAMTETRMRFGTAERTQIRRSGSRAAPMQSSRLARKSSARSRLFPWLCGGAILALSFLATMLLTRPVRPVNPGIAVLTSSVISDAKTLMSAVKAAGFKGATNVRGSIDEIRRLDNDRVNVKGWAVETTNANAPLTVMMFVDGRHRLTTETSGPHAGAIQAVGLPNAASATNVSFEGSLACGRGQKLIVVALADSNAYGYFGSRFCQ
jgi:hypothetical protein